MCEFCNKYHSVKGGIAGAEIKIDKCSNETNLTDCQVVISKNDNPALIIFSHGIAMGYFDIKFCPMCGRKLSEVQICQIMKLILRFYKANLKI